MARRKSIDSSDSESGSDRSGSDSGKDYQKKDKKDKKDKDKKDKSKDKDHKDKKDKDEKKDKKDKDEKKDKGVHGGQHSGGHASIAEVDYKQARFHSSQILNIDQPQALPPNLNFGAHAVSPQPHSSAPPSGYRVPLTTESPFPDAQQTGLPVASDADGSPLFIGSALFDRSVQPCKIGPYLQPYVSVAYGSQEYPHHGRYDLLPFDKNTMEWVPTTRGQVPPGRRPVEGGYEESGAKLYHALANVRGLWVPGKTGEHLGAAHVSFGGSEVPVTEYSILCFR